MKDSYFTSDAKGARMFVEASKRNIEALKGMDDAAVFADEIFGFHVQQAAEKLLQAWLAHSGETYPLTHDLEFLLYLVQRRGVDVSDLSGLTDYTPYAVQFRYEAIGSGTRLSDLIQALSTGRQA